MYSQCQFSKDCHSYCDQFVMLMDYAFFNIFNVFLGYLTAFKKESLKHNILFKLKHIILIENNLTLNSSSRSRNLSSELQNDIFF